jgi:hypothetical protein
MKRLTLLIFMPLLLAIVACDTLDISYRNRTADPGIGEDELFLRIEQAITRLDSGSATLVNSLVFTETFVDDFGVNGEGAGIPTNVWFAESNPETFGPPESVLALLDLSPLGIAPGFFGQEETLPSYDFDYVQVFYIEGFDPSINEMAAVLVVDVQRFDSPDQFETYAIRSLPGGIQVSDKIYSAEMESVIPGESVLLYSYDIDDDFRQLAGVAQLRMMIVDANGQEFKNGKFSTLVGFEIQ